ncbi:MAG: hypothetical protein GXY67_07940 [Clostridiales bacterium]|nr:hypothetical protein [Clostridiales bacterium]
MRTSERLLGLKQWAIRELCQGRSLKAPGETIMDIRRQEPVCYLGWTPRRQTQTGEMEPDPLSVTPGILIMPNPSRARYVERTDLERNFDTSNNVRRPRDLAQTLSISMLFSVYEPGTRLPGFVESCEQKRMDMTLLTEGTEEGLFTLLNWMDDAKEKLLELKSIPGTDLMVQEDSVIYSLYTDQGMVVDKRPIFYGFVNVDFNCYADKGTDSLVEEYLK